MLTQLAVRNLALVEKAVIPFTPGLNVITGETGAGKSVLMGALSLLLGERAEKKVVRTGEDQCSVEGLFHLENPDEVNAILEECGLEPCADGELIIRRIVKTNAAGSILVNDSPVTLALLKRIGDLLVDMHGAYDHQSLLSAETQREILDAAGHSDAEQEAYELVWERLQALRERRAELAGDEESLARELDLIRYKVNELETADLKPGEEEAWRAEHSLCGNAQNILEQLSTATQALTEGEGNAFDALAVARRALAAAEGQHPQASAWLEELTSLQVQARELAASLSQAADHVEADPQRLEWLDQRLGLISQLKRKYGATIDDLLLQLEKARQRLRDLEGREEVLAKLDAEEDGCLKELRTVAAALTRKRVATAKTLGERIRSHLLNLGFPHGRFEIEVTAIDPRASGADLVNFAFAPNPGEAMQPLKSIASSGEISRVMLAVKSILAEYDQIPVLVFDEIDANVGGEMGNAIGRNMAGVARFRQVIAITHLPQVAVYGIHHMAVEKEVSDGRTFTRVRALDDEERVGEIARMLGGRDLTRSVNDHARELLAQAQGT